MPTKPQTGVMSVGSQRDNRYLDTFYDQHRWSPKFPDGRPFHGYREFAANKPDRDGFIGGMLSQGRHAEPGEDPRLAWATIWTAPWLPEYKASYWDFNYQRNKITLRYDAVYADDKKGQDAYYQAAAKLAGANGWGAVTYGVTPSYQVTAVLGDPPRSPKIAQAAQAGDPWLLGFSEEVNEELSLLLGLTVEGLKLVGDESRQIVKPEAILQAATPYDIQKIVAEAVAAALSAEREKNKAKTAKARAAKGKSTTAASQGRPDAA